MGKLTISMAIINSFLYVYQRVTSYIFLQGIQDCQWLSREARDIWYRSGFVPRTMRVPQTNHNMDIMGYTRWYVTKTPWLHLSLCTVYLRTCLPTKNTQTSRRFALVNLGQIELASMINCVSSRTSVSSNGVAWISECWFLVGQTESTLLISPCFTKNYPISILPLDSCWLLVCNENPHCRNNHMWPAIESFPWI